MVNEHIRVLYDHLLSKPSSNSSISRAEKEAVDAAVLPRRPPLGPNPEEPTRSEIQAVNLRNGITTEASRSRENEVNRYVYLYVLIVMITISYHLSLFRAVPQNSDIRAITIEAPTITPPPSVTPPTGRHTTVSITNNNRKKK